MTEGRGQKAEIGSPTSDLRPPTSGLASDLRLPPTLADIERVEGALLVLPQVDMPLQHLFAPGVYLRLIDMPKGTFVIGHEHKTEHFNIVLSGRAHVLVDDVVTEIKAPAVFVSKAGVRKVLHILEDMKWVTVHPTAEIDDCQNIERLEDQLRIKSETFLGHEEEQKAQGEIAA